MADESVVDLPPGFRFHPTDEEIITHYLSPKIVDQSFSASAMGEVDLNRCEPWDLPSKAKMGEKEWYFFCRRDRKYPNGMRTNRATGAGFWKATGKDKEVFRGRGVLVGMKKTLVFYRGRAPKGEKTNWVMHEYRLEGTSMSIPDLPKSAKDEWVVCRVFHKDTGHSKTPLPSSESINSLSDDFLDAPHFNSAASFSSMNHQAVFYTQVVAPGSSSYSLSGSYSRALGAERNDDSSAIRRHCKVEQHSDKSMGCPWQGTGLSADHNTEISSVVSKPYDDLDDPPSTAPFFDLEDMWSF